MDDLEQAEETLAEIKAQLIALDPEYAKDFAE
jgi:ABC-type Zn uptake system ZnuABC Zn-binding protein ZnuA